MVTSHFIAKRVGDRYITVPEEDFDVSAAWVLGGGTLLGVGLIRGGLMGWLASIAGAGFIYRGLTGRNPLSELAPPDPGSLGRKHGEPSYQHDSRNRARQRPVDEVEEASMESFPASDPPASRGR